MKHDKTTRPQDAGTPNEGLPSLGLAAGSANGVTKEMWTVLIEDRGAWQTTDIYCETREAAESMIEMLKRHPVPESKYDITTATPTRCIVSIYPPNNSGQTAATNAAK